MARENRHCSRQRSRICRPPIVHEYSRFHRARRHPNLSPSSLRNCPRRGSHRGLTGGEFPAGLRACPCGVADRGPVRLTILDRSRSVHARQPPARARDETHFYARKTPIYVAVRTANAVHLGYAGGFYWSSEMRIEVGALAPSFAEQLVIRETRDVPLAASVAIRFPRVCASRAGARLPGPMLEMCRLAKYRVITRMPD